MKVGKAVAFFLLPVTLLLSVPAFAVVAGLGNASDFFMITGIVLPKVSIATILASAVSAVGESRLAAFAEVALCRGDGPIPADVDALGHGFEVVVIAAKGHRASFGFDMIDGHAFGDGMFGLAVVVMELPCDTMRLPATTAVPDAIDGTVPGG